VPGENNESVQTVKSRGSRPFVCVTLHHQIVLTHDPTMETAVTRDMYYKWISTNAFSWTLHNIANYLKIMEYLMLFVKSIFVKYTKLARNKILLK
jgi:hypothetical protein